MPLHLPLLPVAFWIAVVMIIALDPVARHLGLLDRPGGRKTHDRAVPVTGGIAMAAGFIVPALLLDASVGVEWGLVAGLAGLVALGVVDDLLDINAWVKLSGQFAAALVMVLSTDHLTGPGALLCLGQFGPAVNAAASAFFIVGLANAFNMIDGLDGLAGGTAAAALAWLAAAAALAGMSGVLMQVLLLLAAVLGFLAFNARHPWRASAAVFMGDAGSLLLGAAIAFFALELAASPAAATPPGPALMWLVALPGFDMTVLIARRLAAGQSPFRADRQHLHHVLLQAGFLPSSAALALVTASGLLGAVGIAGWHAGLPDTALLALLLVPFTAHLYFVLHGWRVVRDLRAIPIADQLPLPGARVP